VGLVEIRVRHLHSDPANRRRAPRMELRDVLILKKRRDSGLA
jgi:hypothetical protein